jgi:hypothetical protein
MGEIVRAGIPIKVLNFHREYPMEYINRKEEIKRKRNLQGEQEHWEEVHNNLIEVQQAQRIQKKSLEISSPGDADEKEADTVARKVVSGESAEIHGTGGTINRKGEGTSETTPEFQTKLESSKGGGQSLEDSTRSEMESKMGADFSGVKIHTGGEASNMSASINAKAFTHGQDIYFGGSHSSENKELLAHELVHTVQQQDNPSIQTKILRQTTQTPAAESSEPRYSFNVPIDKLYTSEEEYLQHCLCYIFSLTPNDANILIAEGWHFESEFKPIEHNEVGGTRSVTVSVASYKKMMGDFAVNHPGSDLGKWLVELMAQLEVTKLRYDEAYRKYGIVVDEVLEEHGYHESDLIFDVPVSTYVAPTGLAEIDPYADEAEDERIIREEREKTYNAFSPLDQEYPDVEWSYNASFKTLEEIAEIVLVEFRKTHLMTDEAADALAAAMVRGYRSSKRKALHAMLAPQLQDQSITPFDDLLFYETLSNNSRQVAFDNGLISQELITSYTTAHSDIIMAELEYKTSGSVSTSTSNIVQFYTNVREFVKEVDRGGSYGIGGYGYSESNVYLEKSTYNNMKERAELATSSKEDWTEIFADFRTASDAMDQFIAEKMKESDNADVVKAGQFLQTTSEAATELDDMLLDHAPVYKVNAIYYTQQDTDYWDEFSSKEAIVNQGYNMQMYLYKEDDEWVLRDLSRAGSGDPIPTNRSTGTLDELFAELDSKLRFPEGEGTLFWEVPALNEGGETAVTGDMTLSEWLTYIGIALAAILFAISTFGVGIPASAVMITSALLITGSVLSMVEKSEQGMLTAHDVGIELLNIVGSAAAGITAGLGKVIVRGVGASGNAAKLAALADRLYFPVIATGVASDVLSFAVITADGIDQYNELDAMPDGPAKEQAMQRLFGTLLLQGVVTILSIKQDIPAMTGKRNLVLDIDYKTGAVTAFRALDVPVGFDVTSFATLSQKLKQNLSYLGNDIRIQGSRASGTANPDSDLDIAIRVDETRFNEILNDPNLCYFGKAKLNNSDQKGKQKCIDNGIIFRGEIYQSDFGKALQTDLNIDKVQISVIKIGGPRDTGPWIPIE